MERFSNPFIHHHWLNIATNATQKMSVRVIPMFIRYVEKFNAVPDYLTTCFAAYLLFMKPVRAEKGIYYGNCNETEYIINDSNAAYFYSAWKNKKIPQFVHDVLSNSALWHTDLTLYVNFEQEIIDKMELIISKGLAVAFQEKQEMLLAH